MATIYLAYVLFNASERLHNLFLEKHLKDFGHAVILPQREALKFFDGNRFNVTGIAHDCKTSCNRKGTIYVGNANGTDADSGTCIEYGMAIMAAGKATVYRIDFRTAEDREIGVNATFNLSSKFSNNPLQWKARKEKAMLNCDKFRHGYNISRSVGENHGSPPLQFEI